MTRRQRRRHRTAYNRIRRRRLKLERWNPNEKPVRWAKTRGTSATRWTHVVLLADYDEGFLGRRMLARCNGVEKWAEHRGLLRKRA